ncbi:MAG: HDOD domain-containing protein [Candidatus Eisenbacteria sp.]|nr:HDOD domain-containing protein [Candidatus Eisenbacteria bacterium]
MDTSVTSESDLVSLLSTVEGRQKFGKRLLRNLRTAGLEDDPRVIGDTIQRETLEAASEEAIKHFMELVRRKLGSGNALTSLFGPDLRSVEFIWNHDREAEESEREEDEWTPLLEKAREADGPVVETVTVSSLDGVSDIEVPQEAASRVAIPVMAGGRSVGFLAVIYSPPKEFTLGEARVLKASAFVLGQTVLEIAGQNETRGVLYAMIQSLAGALDARDSYTRGHSDRVAMYAMALANEMSDQPEEDLAEGFRDRLRLAALLHDIGKIGIRDDVLLKPGSLTNEEYGTIKKHPVLGAEIIKVSGALDHVIPGILYHHERHDGSGYPVGLKGDEIPLVARIIGLADAFDAMTTDRVHRPGMSHAEAIEVIERSSGSHFNPDAVELLLRAHRKGILTAVRVADAATSEGVPVEEEGSLIEQAHPGLADSVPALPAVVGRLNSMVRDPDCGAGDIATVLSTDEGMASRVLKFANSAFYALPGRVGTISLAITILGLNTLRNLVIGAALADMTRSLAGSAREAEILWDHAVAVGVWCRCLARKFGSADPEEAFTAGLLHDIGKGIILRSLPESRQSVRERLLRPEDTRTFEIETVGFDHSQIGAWAAAKWRLPVSLGRTVRWHHEPGGAAGEGSEIEKLVTVVHLANVLAWGGDAEPVVLSQLLAEKADFDILRKTPVRDVTVIEELLPAVVHGRQLARELLSGQARQKVG